MTVHPSNTRALGLQSPVTVNDISATSSDDLKRTQTATATAVGSAPTMTKGGSTKVKHLLSDEQQTLINAQYKKASDDDGVNNSLGAPALYRPWVSLSSLDPSAVMAELMKLSFESANTHTDAVKDQILATKEKVEKNTAFQISNQQRLAEKTIEEAKSARLSKIFGWVGKVSAVIAAGAVFGVALAGTIASGGAGLPMLALASVALVTATISLADQVSKELGGSGITASNLISDTSVKLLEAFGVDHDAALRIGKIMVELAAPVLMVIEPQLAGTMVARICEIAGVSPETAETVGIVAGMLAAVSIGVLAFVATGNVGAMSPLTNVLSKGGLLLSMGTKIAQGATDISIATTQREAEDIKADTTDLKAGALLLQKQMNTDQETLRDLMQSVQDGMQAAIKVVKELFDNLSQISSNMSRRTSA